MNIFLRLAMTVLLVFGLFVVLATAHNITKLEVPQYGDPRDVARLECHYVSDAGDPPLHSVKWYRDNNEIFRYTPEQQPPTRTFNTSSGAPTKGKCNKHNCTIYVALPTKWDTRIAFTCEVSTEGPRFAVVKQTKNLTVAVALKKDPVITGVPSSVQLGEDVILNCSTGYASPPANIVWYIDGKPERTDPWILDNTEVSDADFDGLRASWRVLRYKVNTLKASIGFRCDATQPTRPPHIRSTSLNLVVDKSPHISMFKSAGTNHQLQLFLLTVWMSLHIFSKYSALSEV